MKENEKQTAKKPCINLSSLTKFSRPLRMSSYPLWDPVMHIKVSRTPRESKNFVYVLPLMK
jgi:hypothetical protein